MSDVMVIGIAGGTGSGKTTITKKLMQRFGSNVSVIYHDNYYKAHHDMPYEQRSKLNYDHPNAFDTELLVEAIKKLKQGHAASPARCMTTPFMTAPIRSLWSSPPR